MPRSNTCTREEQIAAIAAICQQYQITSLEAQEVWLHNQGMTPEQMDSYQYAFQEVTFELRS